jgi:hypothetical protein
VTDVEFSYPEITPEVRWPAADPTPRQLKGRGFYLLRGALECFRKIPNPEGEIEDLLNTLEKYAQPRLTHPKR